MLTGSDPTLNKASFLLKDIKNIYRDLLRFNGENGVQGETRFIYCYEVTTKQAG